MGESGPHEEDQDPGWAAMRRCGRAAVVSGFFTVFIKSEAGMGFGSMAPLSTAVEAYSTAKAATLEAKVLYNDAYINGKGISDWIPYYFQGKTF